MEGVVLDLTLVVVVLYVNWFVHSATPCEMHWNFNIGPRGVPCMYVYVSVCVSRLTFDGRDHLLKNDALLTRAFAFKLCELMLRHNLLADVYGCLLSTQKSIDILRFPFG